jgi:hypothetical protein
MFTLSNNILYYNNTQVHHEGETFKGIFNVLIFENNYCYLTKLNSNIDEIIDDYILCTGKQNFDVKIKLLMF